MKFNTAICVTVLGVAVARLDRRWMSRLASFCAALIAGLTMVEYVCGWDLGIDQTIFRDAEGLAVHPGRMAASTALCLVLGAVGLWGLRRARRRVVTATALAMVLVGWLGALGYLFGVEALYAFGPFSTMAGHTTVAMVLLGVGLLASTPDGVLPWIVRGGDPGAALLRRVIPVTFAGLPALAWVRLLGEHRGWYGTAFGLGIMVVIASSTVTAIAVHSARMINRAHVKLQQLNAALEDTVEVRTGELAASEAWARSLAGSAPVGIFRTNAEGRCTYVNDLWCQISGLSSEDALSGAWPRAIHPDDRRRVIADWVAAADRGLEFDAEFRVMRPSGAERWVHAHGTPVHGPDGGFVSTAQDVTDRRDAELAVRRAEELLRTTFESSPVGIALVDEHGRIVRSNPALCALLGVSACDVGDGRLEAVLAVGTEGSGDRSIVRPDGSVRWASVRLAALGGDDDRPSLTIVQLVDTTERHEVEEHLAHLATHDPLTGLLNRRAFGAILDRHAATCARYGPTGALMVLDLDGFKHINDSHGHDIGDRALELVGRVLERRLRDTDFIARLGGDEFAVLLPVADRAGARAVAESVVEEIRASAFTVGGARVQPRCSLGVVMFEAGSGSAEEMLVRADRAMYDAKRRGRDQWAEPIDERQPLLLS
jgi:diguanylate cyclase (GGDEF)-like protein/PAS domain S-box-containing protein